MAMLHATSRGYLGWREAEEYTGLSESTLRRLAREGRIRAFRPTAGRTLLSRAELDAYIESTRIEDSGQIEGNEIGMM